MMGTVISVPSMGAASILLIPQSNPTTTTEKTDTARQAGQGSAMLCTYCGVQTHTHAHNVNTVTAATLHENWLSYLIDD